MISRSDISLAIPHALKQTNFPELGSLRRGKVRDVYMQRDKLFLIATDRVSAFDVILKQLIPFKGRSLTQTANFWFNKTKDIIPNHVIDSPDPNVMIVKKCKVIPIEMVVRGYVAGHLEREYKKGKRWICGVRLPSGLRPAEKLPEPIITPTTKSRTHDIDISRKEILRQKLVSKKVYEQMEDVALRLFKRGANFLKKQGLILVDTKYEFADDGGTLTLVDEVHTGDSSRFWVAGEYKERFESGKPQRALDKEYIRQWLREYGYTGMHKDAAKEGVEQKPLPDLPEEVIITAAKRYIEAYERITGQQFKLMVSNISMHERIRQALVTGGYLK